MIKHTLLSAAVISMMSASAYAHPAKKQGEGALAGGDKHEKTTVITIPKGNFSWEGMDDFNFEFLENLEDLESLEDLEGLEGLGDLLRNLGVEVIEGEDGDTQIILKRGPGSKMTWFGDDGENLAEPIEGRAERHKKHKKHIMKLRKHKKLTKHAHRDEDSRGVIKRLLKNHKMGDDENVHIMVRKHKLVGDNHEDAKAFLRARNAAKGNFPNVIALDDDMEISVDKDGEITIMKNGKEISQSMSDDLNMSVNKSITNDNGKRKTRIVIEMESPE